MKLKDYLKDIDNKTRLYIGSKSSFFYIGTKPSTKTFEEIEQKYLNNFKKALKYAKMSVNEITEDINKTKAKIKHKKALFEETNKKILLKEIETLENGIKALEFDLKQKELIIKYNEKAIETFKPFLEREIIYVFLKQTMVDEQGIAIKLEGYESGKYWTYKEWINRDK